MVLRKNGLILIADDREVFVLNIFEIFSRKFLELVKRLLSNKNQIHSVAGVLVIVEFLETFVNSLNLQSL